MVGKTARMGKRGNMATRGLKAPKVVQEAMDYQVFKGCVDSQVLQVQWEGKGKRETED